MKAECVRDLNRKYLVMTDDSDGYQTEMLIRNKAEGFIPVKKIDWDNEIRLYYDITGKPVRPVPGQGLCKKKGILSGTFGASILN